MAKTATETVNKSNKKRGITATSVKLSPEEKALWDELAESNGGRKASLIKALNLLKGQNQPSNAELLQMLKDRLE